LVNSDIEKIQQEVRALKAESFAKQRIVICVLVFVILHFASPNCYILKVAIHDHSKDGLSDTNKHTQ